MSKFYKMKEECQPIQESNNILLYETDTNPVKTEIQTKASLNEPNFNPTFQ